MSEPRKTLLVHVSAFKFDSQTYEDSWINQAVLTFLNDARRKYDIVIVGDDPDQIREKLKQDTLQKGLKQDKRISTDFLQQNVDSVESVSGQSFNVILSDDLAIRMLVDSYDIHICSGDTDRPDFFHYFEEIYDENVGAHIACFFSGRIALFDAQLETMLGSLPVNVQQAWVKANQLPKIIELANIFKRFKQRQWEDAHPKDLLLEKLQRYFELALLAKTGRSPSALPVHRELLAFRTSICSGLASRLKEPKYERMVDGQEIEIPKIKPDGRAQVYAALYTLNTYARTTLATKPPSLF